MGAVPKLEPTKELSRHQEHDDDDSLEVHHHKKVEEGEGPWLVSYADMMTLLMGFFALISSFSKPDMKAFEKVKEQASESFGGEYKKPYEGLADELKKFIEQSDLKGHVRVEFDADGVKITIEGTVLYNSGDFQLRQEAAQVIEKLADKIKDRPEAVRVHVEGHTDSVPIRHEIIASNWELSGLRAARVAQVFEARGFDKKRLSLVGWGETRPEYSEHSESGEALPENMAKNRRTVIRLYDPKLSNAPSFLEEGNQKAGP